MWPTNCFRCLSVCLSISNWTKRSNFPTLIHRIYQTVTGPTKDPLSIRGFEVQRLPWTTETLRNYFHLGSRWKWATKGTTFRCYEYSWNVAKLRKMRVCILEIRRNYSDHLTLKYSAVFLNENAFSLNLKYCILYEFNTIWWLYVTPTNSNFGGHILFVGLLILVFWTSGNVCLGFESQAGYLMVFY